MVPENSSLSDVGECYCTCSMLAHKFIIAPVVVVEMVKWIPNTRAWIPKTQVWLPKTRTWFPGVLVAIAWWSRMQSKKYTTN